MKLSFSLSTLLPAASGSAISTSASNSFRIAAREFMGETVRVSFFHFMQLQIAYTMR